MGSTASGSAVRSKANRTSRSTARGSAKGGRALRLSDDPALSEQNPVQFEAPDGRTLILHTAQPGGDQDACVIRMREAGAAPLDLPLRTGTFIRGPIHVRRDGAWLLPLFRCISRPGQRWTGSHDTAALAISEDAGKTWREVEAPGLDRLGAYDPGTVGRRSLRRLFPPPSGRFRASERKPGWRRELDGTGTDRSSQQQFLDFGDTPSRRPHRDRRTSLYDEIGDDARPNAEGGCSPIWGVPRAPMATGFSEDGGLTFPRRILVDDGPGTCLSNNSLDGRNRELSYPSLIEGADGSLDLAYTFHRRAIKHVRLTTTWLERA